MYSLLRGVKAVFLDLGNTLAYYAPSPPGIIARVLKRWGYSVPLAKVSEALSEAEEAYMPVRRKILKRFKADPLRYVELPLDYEIEVNLYMLKLLGIPPDERLAREIALEFRKTETVALYPDVIPVLSELRERGLKLGIVSNASSFAEEVIKDKGLASLVDFYVISYAVGYEKPHPKIFEEALRRAGTKPAETIHVGDSYEADVVGARNAGITPILVDREKSYNTVDCIKIHTLWELLDILT